MQSSPLGTEAEHCAPDYMLASGPSWVEPHSAVGWVEQLGSAFQKEPTLTVHVSFDPEQAKRLDSLEARIAGLEQQLKSIAAPAVQGDDLKSRFDLLVAQWKAGRGHKSSVQSLAMHPAYQQIIGLGERVLPFLLAEMENQPSHWTWALRAITGTNPVPEGSKGKLKEMAAAWAKWGRENGYLQ